MAGADGEAEIVATVLVLLRPDAAEFEPPAALTAGVMIALFVYLRKKRLPGYAWAGFGLILGGAAGNLFDRLAYGYVIDMLEPLFARLFVFNPADAAVVCGAVLLGVYLLFGKEDTPDERA